MNGWSYMLASEISVEESDQVNLSCGAGFQNNSFLSAEVVNSFVLDCLIQIWVSPSNCELGSTFTLSQKSHEIRGLFKKVLPGLIWRNVFDKFRARLVQMSDCEAVLSTIISFLKAGQIFQEGHVRLSFDLNFFPLAVSTVLFSIDTVRAQNMFALQ